ncbi:pyridoxal-phosphate dependent enzyme [Variovorax gossypii]|uniref:Pyridoxal-phosphate dependent enzyme n=1 Tax=Variovorax gossypii TaxID=1679495 RepID=A0A3S0Q8S3_9BURK|nr:pyridoxal-phosphate dependent enzyme [Variovorax gossypii]RTQ32974.1 pyridoxal-phosphate dependent enzyme [Variovorax gossypii]
MSTPASLRCLRCGTHHALDYQGPGCARCHEGLASNLRVEYRTGDIGHWNFRESSSAKRGMGRFSAMLPVQQDQLVTLGEGETPLHEAGRLGKYLGIRNLHVKDESRNPTHSYKDRLSAVAVSYAKQRGAPAVATASSGNAGASLAAYAARAGMPCVVASMKGASGPMVAQIRKLGAHLILMEDKAMRWPLLAEAAKRYGWFITSPYSSPVVGSTPFGIEGYKTIAYEIFEDLGRAPDWIALPVCYGDALAGIHQGFLDLERAGAVKRVPRFIAAEAYGSLGRAIASRADRVEAAPIESATLASSVGGAQSAYQALLTLKQTDGIAIQVGNDGLVELQELIGSLEGLCFELASVMPFAAVRQLRDEGTIAADDLVVCLATASGLKDIDKSTLDWEDVPVNSEAQEQVLETAQIAVQQIATQMSHVQPGVTP